MSRAFIGAFFLGLIYPSYAGLQPEGSLKQPIVPMGLEGVILEQIHLRVVCGIMIKKMRNLGFIKSLEKEIKKKNSHICVGLDSDYEKIPFAVRKNKTIENAIFTFNKEIIDATNDLVVAYKQNISFYAGFGIDGLRALVRTNQYLMSKYPSIKKIADCKRSEMKRSAELVAKEIFEEFLFDALTVTPWFGFDTIEPYQKYKNKAVFVLCHDSNPSASEIQDLELKNGMKLYEVVTRLVCNKWNRTGNILIEASLTYPDVLKRIVKISTNEQFFLIVGLGVQGGDINVLAEFKKNGNFIISASRSIIFASDGKNFTEISRSVVKNYLNRLKNVT